eukprot:1154955-Pelagomonas_calceolata.AAC.13
MVIWTCSNSCKVPGKATQALNTPSVDLGKGSSWVQTLWLTTSPPQGLNPRITSVSRGSRGDTVCKVPGSRKMTVQANSPWRGTKLGKAEGKH